MGLKKFALGVKIKERLLVHYSNQDDTEARPFSVSFNSNVLGAKNTL